MRGGEKASSGATGFASDGVEHAWRYVGRRDPFMSDVNLHARAMAHESWAQTEDRTARTAPGRKAAWDRFEKQVDPDGLLPPEERAKRAANARKAHFTRMAMRSAAVRRAKRTSR